MASQMNHKHKDPRTAQLVERFMAEVDRFAEEDWEESDGWVAQLVLWVTGGSGPTRTS